MVMSSKAIVIPRAMTIGMGDPRVDRKAIPASGVVLVISQNSALLKVICKHCNKKTHFTCYCKSPSLHSQSHGPDHGKDQSGGEGKDTIKPKFRKYDNVKESDHSDKHHSYGEVRRTTITTQ